MISMTLVELYRPHLTGMYLAVAVAVLLPLLFKLIPFSKIKGGLGERGVRSILARLDEDLYRSFHDVYLPRSDGPGTTQVDHVIASPYGVFVIETKNYKGWIFGKEHESDWTQKLGRRSFRFQNPLHQNHAHVCALVDFLALPEDRFIPGVFFVGKARLKTRMPGNVIDDNFLAWVKQHTKVLLQPDEVSRVITTLERHVQNTHRPTSVKAHRSFLARRA